VPAKLNLKIFQKIAKNRGGECLSEKYINARTKLIFKCKEGHTWKAIPNHIKNNNTWCPYCAERAKIGLPYFQKFAKDRGGECLSEKYIGNHQKITFKCKEEHIWERHGSAIKQKKTWCLTCASIKRTEEENKL